MVANPKPFHESIVDEANTVNDWERLDWTERDFLVAAIVLAEVTRRTILPKNHGPIQESLEIMFAGLGKHAHKDLLAHIAAEKARVETEAAAKKNGDKKEEGRHIGLNAWEHLATERVRVEAAKAVNEINGNAKALPETLEAMAEWFLRNTAASRQTIMPATCLNAAVAIRVLLEQVQWLKSDPGHNADWEEMVRVLAEIEAKVVSEKIQLADIVDEARREKARAINAF